MLVGIEVLQMFSLQTKLRVLLDHYFHSNNRKTKNYIFHLVIVLQTRFYCLSANVEFLLLSL